MATALIQRVPSKTITKSRVWIHVEKRLLSTPPRARRGAEPEKKSFFGRIFAPKEPKVLLEGQASGKQIAKGLAVAFGVQFIFCGISMSGEAISELKGYKMIAEIPATISTVGIFVSGWRFR
jgi:hypothetical protein